MKKISKILGFVVLLAVITTLTGTVLMNCSLKKGVVRLHVVADSDSVSDQNIKLRVRDAVLEAVQEDLVGCSDMNQAKQYLQTRLDNLETVANNALRDAGSTDIATVTLCREAFSVRDYDTFSLPSGVYESLRVTIGSGEGKNWWCVVFPAFCFGATTEEFSTCAAGAGFSDVLTNTLTGEPKYELSFFLLDCLGKLENLFHFR